MCASIITRCDTPIKDNNCTDRVHVVLSVKLPSFQPSRFRCGGDGSVRGLAVCWCRSVERLVPFVFLPSVPTWSFWWRVRLRALVYQLCSLGLALWSALDLSSRPPGRRVRSAERESPGPDLAPTLRDRTPRRFQWDFSQPWTDALLFPFLFFIAGTPPVWGELPQVWSLPTPLTLGESLYRF